jgi:hypothetical protein
MITNVPTSEALHASALRAFFETWSLVLRIATEFDEVYRPDDGDWTEERTQYLSGCQRDLQTALSSMQLASELALKARIAEVSPYLLLIGGRPTLSSKPSNIDFADFRTLDAQDLPAAVNCYTAPPLTDQFLQDYKEIRSLRNKVVHLGSVDRHFNPDDLLARMARQFAELWPQRRWLVERLKHANGVRHAFFHDGKYSSAEGEVFSELDQTFSRFGKTLFKQLIGFEKSARRYLCAACLSNSEARNVGLDLNTCRAAVLTPEGGKVKCAMCQGEFDITRVKCTDADCKGDVCYDAPDDAPICLSCGNYHE